MLFCAVFSSALCTHECKNCCFGFVSAVCFIFIDFSSSLPLSSPFFHETSNYLLYRALLCNIQMWTVSLYLLGKWRKTFSFLFISLSKFICNEYEMTWWRCRSVRGRLMCFIIRNISFSQLILLNALSECLPGSCWNWFSLYGLGMPFTTLSIYFEFEGSSSSSLRMWIIFKRTEMKWKWRFSCLAYWRIYKLC